MKKNILVVFYIFIIILLATALTTKTKNNNNNSNNDNNVDISSYYNKYVITKQDSKIYDSSLNEIGIIGKNVELSLADNHLDKYIRIKDFEDTYIEYTNIDKLNKLSQVNDRYKVYIPFNENILTNNNTALYDENNNLIYLFNKEMSLPIIIKDTNKYGVEYNDRLLYVKSEDSNIVNNYNSDKVNSSGVGVLNYHAFYDETIPEDACPTYICHSKSQFKSQLDLFKQMNLLSITMDELEKYIDGKIQLPRSVVITIDDGARSKLGIDMLTEYKMYATIFLVTSWYDENEYYVTDYIELHSHTHNMHDGGVCPGGQGGAIKCLGEQFIQNDLSQSRKELNGSVYFAYPFYEYNDYSIEMLKKAGFRMAFVGETFNGDNLVHVNSNKYKLNRFVINIDTTLESLREYFDQIKY